MRFDLQIAEPNEFYPKFKCNFSTREADVVMYNGENLDVKDNQILLEPTQEIPRDGKTHQLYYDGPEGGWVANVSLPAPAAVEAIIDSAPEPGLTVHFDATQSHGGVGLLSVLWDFGDGTTSTEPITSHTYPQPGNYSVVLTVTDFYNTADTAEVEVELVPEFQLEPMQLAVTAQDYPFNQERKVVVLDENLDLVRELKLDTDLDAPEDQMTAGLRFLKSHETTSTHIPLYPDGTFLGRQPDPFAFPDPQPDDPELFMVVRVQDKGVAAPIGPMAEDTVLLGKSPDYSKLYMASYEEYFEAYLVVAVDVDSQSGAFLALPNEVTDLESSDVGVINVSGRDFLYFTITAGGYTDTIVTELDDQTNDWFIWHDEDDFFGGGLIHGHREDDVLQFYRGHSEEVGGSYVISDAISTFDLEGTIVGTVYFSYHVNEDLPTVDPIEVQRKFYLSPDDGVIVLERTGYPDSPQAITKREAGTYDVQWSVSSVSLGISNSDGLSDVLIHDNGVYAIFGYANLGTYNQTEVTVVHLDLQTGAEINRAVFPVAMPALPIAEITVHTEPIVAGMSAEFTGANLSGVPVSLYSWTINGTNLTGDNVSYSFPDSGIYSVELTVTDYLGRTDSTSVDVEVEEAPDATLFVTSQVNDGVLDEHGWMLGEELVRSVVKLDADLNVVGEMRLDSSPIVEATSGLEFESSIPFFDSEGAIYGIKLPYDEEIQSLRVTGKGAYTELPPGAPVDQIGSIIRLLVDTGSNVLSLVEYDLDTGSSTEVSGGIESNADYLMMPATIMSRFDSNVGEEYEVLCLIGRDYSADSWVVELHDLRDGSTLLSIGKSDWVTGPTLGAITGDRSDNLVEIFYSDTLGTLVYETYDLSTGSQTDSVAVTEDLTFPELGGSLDRKDTVSKYTPLGTLEIASVFQDGFFRIYPEVGTASKIRLTDSSDHSVIWSATASDYPGLMDIGADSQSSHFFPYISDTRIMGNVVYVVFGVNWYPVERKQQTTVVLKLDLATGAELARYVHMNEFYNVILV